MVQESGEGIAQPDWYADPAGRHQHRYWDGASWTVHVADDGAQSDDPLTPASEKRARRAEAHEHYVLKCRACDFSHAIPGDSVDPPAAFSVDVGDVRLQVVYGGMFTVTLGVKEFFTVAPAPQSGAVLHASIGDNMKVLHAHIMSHCDPVFLVIRQTSGRTDQEYKRQPDGSPYVSISEDRGIDIVGDIDVSKAEIPGVSW